MLRRFLPDRHGASAAEFALVLPAALLLLFGIIDVGRYAWQLNEYEKATQMGARYAIVTDVVWEALADDELTWVGEPYCNDDDGGLQTCIAGQTIAPEGLGTVTCTSSSCTCSDAGGAFCPSGTAVDSTAFGRIVERMQTFQPRIAAGDVRIEYSGSGLGFAGDPHKPEVAPFVTVRVADAQYDSITLSLVGGTVPLPDFSYTLTLEDGEGIGAAS